MYSMQGIPPGTPEDLDATVQCLRDDSFYPYVKMQHCIEQVMYSQKL